MKSISKEHIDYENSKVVIDKIDKKYHSVISNMQKELKVGYDKTLTDNKLKDIDKISNKDKLNNAKGKLNELLQIIKNEKEIVCTENELNEYELKIVELLKSYEDRITKIEEAERKVSEEATKKATKKKQQSSSKSNSSKSRNPSSSSSSNNSGNQKLPWYYGMEHVIAWNEKGEKTEFYRDSAGNMYDMNGNCINW